MLQLAMDLTEQVKQHSATKTMSQAEKNGEMLKKEAGVQLQGRLLERTKTPAAMRTSVIDILKQKSTVSGELQHAVEKEEKSRIAFEKDRKDFIAWKVALLRTEHVKEHGEFEEGAEAPWAKTQEEKVESTLKTWEGHMDLPLPFGDNKGKGVLKYKEPKASKARKPTSVGSRKSTSSGGSGFESFLEESRAEDAKADEERKALAKEKKEEKEKKEAKKEERADAKHALEVEKTRLKKQKLDLKQQELDLKKRAAYN